MSEAENKIGRILDGARNGRLQRLKANDGVFEVVFKPNSGKPRVGEVLARGGPVED